MFFILIILFSSLNLNGAEQEDIVKYKDFNLFLYVPQYMSDAGDLGYKEDTGLERFKESKTAENYNTSGTQVKNSEQINKEIGIPVMTNNKISGEKQSIRKTADDEILDDEAILYKNGLELYNNRDYNSSESVFIELLQKYPDTRYKDKATFYLGKIMSKQGKYEESLLYFNKIKDDFSGSSLTPQAMYNAAEIYMETGKSDESVKLLMFLQKKYPNSEIIDKSYLLLGDVYRKRGEVRNAINKYQKILSKFKKSTVVDDALFKLGDLYENEPEYRNFELANKYYQMIVDKHPDSEYLDSAQERIKFIKENFLEYK